MNQPFVARLSRVLRAEPTEVFAAWTDAEDLKAWFLPGENVDVVTVELDARQGGRYRIVMRDEDGDHDYGGEYLEFVPGERLVFTWIGPATNHTTSVVTIDFKAVIEGTELTLTHEKLPSAEQASSFQGGWGRIFQLLADRIEK